MARIDFAEIQHSAHRLEQQAAVLEYHRRNKRVTHTIKAILECAKHLRTLMLSAQTGNQFVASLRYAFEVAYDARGGGMQFTPADDGTIFIHGAFDAEKLRRYVLALPTAQTIETEHVDG